MKFLLSIATVVLALFATPALSAKLEAKIDLSEQKMRVYQNGVLRASWNVSTGRRGFHTPTGNFRPTRMYKKYYSKKYYNSPMPHSIFFRGGYAIHGTGAIRQLGRPASHGCVRLHPNNAAQLYGLVQQAGPRNVKISIVH